MTKTENFQTLDQYLANLRVRWTNEPDNRKTIEMMARIAKMGKKAKPKPDFRPISTMSGFEIEKAFL